MSTEGDILKALSLVAPLAEVGRSIFDAIQAASVGDLEGMKRAHANAMAANALAVLEIAKAELK